MSRHPDDSIAASLGIRLIAVDRCGPPVRRSSLRAFAEEFVAALPVERFGVIGWSAGGPHALAVAAVAPDRVERVAVVGSLPPPAGLDAVSRDVRLAIRLSRVAPRIAARRLEAWGRQPVPPTGHSSTDEAYARGRIESFRHGGRWLAYELGYLARPWGFELEDVLAPVTLWWGDLDDTCPPSIGRAYAERLPNARLKVVEGSHQLLFQRWRDILASAGGSGRSPGTRPL